MDEWIWCKGGMKLPGRNLKCSGKKPVTVLLFPPHIRHGPHSEKPVTNHVCCVTSFVTLRSEFNVLCIYVSDFKEPYPARTAYQVAKLPLVRDVLSFVYGSKVWGLCSDDCEDCCVLWCIVFWCNCANGQCSYVRLHSVISQNTAALTVSNYSWSICCNVWKYENQHSQMYM